MEVVCDAGYTGGGVAKCGSDGKFTLTECVPSQCATTQVENSNFAKFGSIKGITGDKVKVLFLLWGCSQVLFEEGKGYFLEL